MTRSGEILKSIYDVLIEIDLAVPTHIDCRGIHVRLTHDEAVEVAIKIFARMAVFVYDVQEDPPQRGPQKG
jgi:hypothetical protein